MRAARGPPRPGCGGDPTISYPLGYHAELVSGTPNAPTAHLKFLSFTLAALLGAFLVLQAALESWVLALLVLLALPAALSGGVIVALATRQARTLGADAGLVAIFAVAVRQSLLQAVAIRRLALDHHGELTTELSCPPPVTGAPPPWRER